MIVSTFLGGTNLLLAWNAYRNVKNRQTLRAPQKSVSRIWVGVTLAMPVRNEEKNLQRLLAQISNQITLPEEIIFLDDQSTDQTLQLLTDFRVANPGLRVRIFSGRALPEGWRGKVWALQQLLENIETEKVLFLDADVELVRTDALAALAERSQDLMKESLDFLSVFPTPNSGTTASLLVHQVAAHLHWFMPSFRDRIPAPYRGSAVAGCGQMMLAYTSTLNRHQFIPLLKGSTHDGLGLARAHARKGGRVTWVHGEEFIQSPGYENFSSAFEGYARNSFEATGGWLGAVVLSFLLLEIFVAPLMMFPFLMWNPVWMGSWVALIFAQLKLAQSLGAGADNVVMAPVRAVASVGVHLWSVARHKLGRKTLWRGRPV